MVQVRHIEIFSAGCPVCDDTVRRIRAIARPSCIVTVLNMNEPSVSARAATLGIRSLPAVATDGKLADCCAGRGPDEATLRTAGLSRPAG